MASKHHPADHRSPYRLEDLRYGPPALGDSEAKSWTDGLPHDFKGWGPQTPNPDEPVSEVVSGQPQSLTWDGEGDAHNHHVWRFDGRRRHHH